MSAETRTKVRSKPSDPISFCYPHMCRDEHAEVGWRGDEELCPVCRERGERERSGANAEGAREWAERAMDELRDSLEPSDVLAREVAPLFERIARLRLALEQEHHKWADTYERAEAAESALREARDREEFICVQARERVVPGRSARLERERDEARAKLRDLTGTSLLARANALEAERAHADRLAEALNECGIVLREIRNGVYRNEAQMLSSIKQTLGRADEALAAHRERRK